MTLILLCVAVWRLTYMLAEEIGPGKIFHRLREKFIDFDVVPHKWGLIHDGSSVPIEYRRVGTPKNIIGDILNCFYCLSVWVSFPLCLLYLLYTGETPWAFPVLWLGSSGIAILIQKVHSREE